MKFSTVSCLLAALYSATFVLADALQENEPTPASVPQYTAAEATAAPVLAGDEPKLEVRQGAVVVNPAAGTVAALQYPSITTQWVQSTIGSSTTYLQIIYTQTFASVPDQWQTAGKGTIGYGTLTKNGKRDDLVARQTGYLQPVVLEMQTEIVTEYLHAVTEVMVWQTFTILPNMTYHGFNGSYSGINGIDGTYTGVNGTYPGINGTFGTTNGTYLGINGTYHSLNGTYGAVNGNFNVTNGTINNTTSARNYTLPATLNTGTYLYPTAGALH